MRMALSELPMSWATTRMTSSRACTAASAAACAATSLSYSRARVSAWAHWPARAFRNSRSSSSNSRGSGKLNATAPSTVPPSARGTTATACVPVLSRVPEKEG